MRGMWRRVTAVDNFWRDILRSGKLERQVPLGFDKIPIIGSRRTILELGSCTKQDRTEVKIERGTERNAEPHSKAVAISFLHHILSLTKPIFASSIAEFTNLCRCGSARSDPLCSYCLFAPIAWSVLLQIAKQGKHGSDCRIMYCILFSAQPRQPYRP